MDSTVENERSHWRTTALLAALVAIGFALRIVAIGREALWSDEALTAILVRYPWWSFPFTSVEATPPLFYWLQKALVPEGANPAAWRMVSLVAGTLTIPLAYWFGRELHSRRAGLVAAGVVAMAAPLIDYSQEARAYAMAVMMVAGSAAALAAIAGGRLAGLERRGARRRMLALFAIFTVGAAWSHFVAIFWVLPALYLLRMAADGSRPVLSLREVLATWAGMLPFLAIELHRQYIFRHEQDSFSWLPQPSPAKVVTTLGEQWLPFVQRGGAAAALVALALLTGLAWAIRRNGAAWVRERPVRALILLALLLEPAALWLLGTFAAPVAMPRTFLPAMIGFAGMLGVAVAMLKPPIGTWVGASAVGLTLASTLSVGTVRHKEPWAEVASKLAGAPFVIGCPNWKVPALLAKDRGKGWLVTSYGDHALAVRVPGDRASWDKLYFDRIQQYGHYPMKRAMQPRVEPIPVRTKTLIFVASECSAIERHAFEEWAGLKAKHLVWEAPARGDVASIRIEQWTVSDSKPLDLWIVR